MGKRKRLNLQQYQESTLTITVPIPTDDQEFEITLTFYPGRLSDPTVEGMFQSETATLRDLILYPIKSWDIAGIEVDENYAGVVREQNDDGTFSYYKPVPPTVEGLDEAKADGLPVPDEVLEILFAEMRRQVNPNQRGKRRNG